MSRLNLAIPFALALSFSPMLVQPPVLNAAEKQTATDNQPPQKGWLGISIGSDSSRNHVVVESVKDNSTASEMGLKANDLITQFTSDKKTWDINENVDLKNTRLMFEKLLDKNNIKKEQAHPQILKLVIDRLMK